MTLILLDVWSKSSHTTLNVQYSDVWIWTQLASFGSNKSVPIYKWQVYNIIKLLMINFCIDILINISVCIWSRMGCNLCKHQRNNSVESSEFFQQDFICHEQGPIFFVSQVRCIWCNLKCVSKMRWTVLGKTPFLFKITVR